MPVLSSPNSTETLYRDHNSWLRGWLHKKLGCSQRAADLAQDTFVRLLSADGASVKVESIREPRTYLATIANRVMIDHLRRRRLEKAYLDALQSQPELVDISPEQRLIMLQTLQELDAMLAGLGRDIRRAFLMSQLQGMRYADIAEELGVALVTVKKYMAKATAQCLLYALDSGIE